MPETTTSAVVAASAAEQHPQKLAAPKERRRYACGCNSATDGDFVALPVAVDCQAHDNAEDSNESIKYENRACLVSGSRRKEMNSMIQSQIANGRMMNPSSTAAATNMVEELNHNQEKQQQKRNHYNYHDINQHKPPQDKRVATTTTTSGSLYKQSVVDHNTFSLGRQFAICCTVVLALSCSIYIGEAASRSGVGAPSASAASQSSASTIAYGDPIKWSFGGWAPLDGAKNGTKSGKGDAGRQQQQQRQQQVNVGPTSPLPPTARPSSANLHNNNTLRAAGGGEQKGRAHHVVEPMKESASSNAHDKMQFSGSHNLHEKPSSPQSANHHNHPHHQQLNNQPPHKLQIGPAYALPLQKSPTPPVAMKYSQPAPVPIVREQLIPTANQKQVNFLPGPPPPSQAQAQAQQHPGAHPHYLMHNYYPHHPAASSTEQQNINHQQQQQHRQPHMMAQQQRYRHNQGPPPPMMGPPPGYYEHQKMMQEHHMRQHQMFQQMMYQQQQQQQPQTPRGMGGATGYQPNQPRGLSPSYPSANGQQVGPVGPYRPQENRPAVHHHQPMMQQQPNGPPVPMGQYKVSEGDGDERPVAFTSSLPEEQIPLLEINGSANGTMTRQQQQPQVELTSTTLGALGNQDGGGSGGGHLYGSTLEAANGDKMESLNYQAALSQVTAEHATDDQQQQPDHHHHYHQQSNNIQDIKQRQQYEQQNQATAGGGGQSNSAQDNKATLVGRSQPGGGNQNARPSSYLTIPVAVETEGDKILTPDDINEIEKHVIKVLPNLKTADKIVKMADAHLGAQLADHIKATTTAAVQQAIEQEREREQQVAHTQGPPEIHQINYNEHRMTLKELDSAMGPPSPSTAATKGPGHQSSPATKPLPQQQQQQLTTMSQFDGPIMSQVTIAADDQQPTKQQQMPTTTLYHLENHHEAAPVAQPGPPPDGPSAGNHEPRQQQYFVPPTGRPMPGNGHELIGPLDGEDEQMADYNLIKNDLLHNFRYEPTRSQQGSTASGYSSSSRGPQTASTPPMPYPQTSPAHNQHQQQHQSRRPQVIELPQQQQQQQYQNQELTTGKHLTTPSVSMPSQQPSSPGRQYMVQSAMPTPRPLRHFGRPRNQANSYGGRGGGSSTAGSATTKTIMGGRRVSDVMRALIHTTPVPMTSPIHVPSVEPEKVDAIQLIAGNANDKQPIVVEPHQLVNHTPDGGFDFNSGAPLTTGPGQPSPSNAQPVHADGDDGGQPQPQHPQPGAHESEQEQQPPRQQRQYLSGSLSAGNNPTSAAGNGNDGGAVIEYVAMNEPLGNNQQQQQPYEISGQQQQQPEAAPVSYVSVEQGGERENNGGGGSSSNSAPATGDNNRGQQPIYDYTMTTQPIQQASLSQAELDAPQHPQVLQQVQPQQQQQQEAQPVEYGGGQSAGGPQGQQPSLAWSPSLADHHNQQQQQQLQQQQQQLMELAEHSGGLAMQDMPATAGYNFFSQQQEQPPPASVRDHEYDQQPQQHEQHEHEDGKAGWRSKAGGSLPNPDAQYDGQIVKGEQEQPQQQLEPQTQNNQPPNQEPIEPENQQQQYQPANNNNYANQQQQTIELSRLTQSQDPARPQEDHEQQQQQQQNDNESGDAYHRQQQYHPEQQQVSNTQPPGNNNNAGGYMSTNSYVGGTQFNQQQQQQPPSNADYQQVDGKYSYMKLDSDQQLAHLAQQQAQHQARLAEMLSTQPQLNGYQTQTTTPFSSTIPPADINQQQQQQEMEDKMASVGGGQNGAGYMVEPVPSVQSQPDSMQQQQQQMPISDQQSLISEPDNESDDQFSDDDRAKQQYSNNNNNNIQPHKQPTAVYQVYQAYYAPKDHKPLPGYVRLSLQEFNELFRDAEIQYVDKNMNRLQNPIGTNNDNHHHNANYEQQQQEGAANAPNEMMKASGSEQSIVVDRRSITGSGQLAASSINSTTATKHSGDGSSSAAAKLNLSKKSNKPGLGVKKIITIRNSRPIAKQDKVVATHTTRVPSSALTNKMTTILPEMANGGGGGLTMVPAPTSKTTSGSGRKAFGGDDSVVKQQKHKKETANRVKTFNYQPSTIPTTSTPANTKPPREYPTTTITHSLGDKKTTKKT